MEFVKTTDLTKLFRGYREKAGLTLKEVALKLGSKNHNLYKQYEDKPIKLSLEMFDKIITALGLNLSVMITDKKLTLSQMKMIRYVIENKEIVDEMIGEIEE